MTEVSRGGVGPVPIAEWISSSGGVATSDPVVRTADVRDSCRPEHALGLRRKAPGAERLSGACAVGDTVLAGRASRRFARGGRGPWAAGVIHCGPRKAATCGVGRNNVRATGAKMLGDVRGGAGEKCADFHPDIAARHDWGASLDAATRDGCANWLETHGTIVSDAVSMDRSIRAHFG